MSTRDRTRISAADFDDQGKPFFEDFKDPLACTDLEVVDFDPSTATASRFRVMFKDKKWVIPSHYNYPADAKDRLSKTSAALMDLTKDTIRSDSTDAQESMGVIDPLDAKVTTLEGTRQADHASRRVGESSRRHHHRQRDQGDRAQRRRGPALRAGARPEANLRREHQGRAVDAVRRLDRDQPAQGRNQQDPPHRFRQLQDSGRPSTPDGWCCSAARSSTITRKDGTGPWTMDDIPRAKN